MSEQKPQCRVQADEKQQGGWHSFPHCGLEYKQLFSCSVCLLCLHTHPASHSSPCLFQVPPFFLDTFSFLCILFWEFILWFLLISSVYMQFLFFALRFFYFFFLISTWVPFLTFLELCSFHFFFFPTTLSLLIPMLSRRKVVCGPWNPEQQRKLKYPPLFPLHLSLYDDWDWLDGDSQSDTFLKLVCVLKIFHLHKREVYGANFLSQWKDRRIKEIEKYFKI